MPFLLDTNTYFLFFQPEPKPTSYTCLREKLKSSTEISFYISEITSMEIHSVLGKYRRGSPRQAQKCNREISISTGTAVCPNTWISPARKPLKLRVFRNIQKLVKDIESQRGDIQATVLALNQPIIDYARNVLMHYADRYSFGSHDALIAGCLMNAQHNLNINLTLVTSDKALKAVLKEEGLCYYDPQNP
ncbi:MAG: hypothetical protein JW901_03775 [Dehalococcoidia bacterium]|nr:hypothetical protein [Dehalococcoidia bacterium]